MQKKNNLSVIAMGHGCSYGDLFIHSEGIIINFKNLNKVINFNSQISTKNIENIALKIKKVSDNFIK